tara:strand:- start:4171 stop:4569 length:399 start_codon:yes stop_codon:yes gene_type:complete
MELIDFLIIKRNIEDILENELNGNPKKQIKEYILMLENELIKNDVKIPISKEIEIDLDDFIDEVENQTEYYIGKQYTKKDLENECVNHFEKHGVNWSPDDLDPLKYQNDMRKAYYRLQFRKRYRSDKLKNKI